MTTRNSQLQKDQCLVCGLLPIHSPQGELHMKMKLSILANRRTSALEMRTIIVPAT